MKIVFNNIIPFRGFKAVNIFGVLFARKGVELSSRLINHEEIHSAQMNELLYVPFYIIYFFEWLFRLAFHTKTAYRGISFEKEAYAHQDDLTYLDKREPFAQWRDAQKNAE